MAYGNVLLIAIPFLTLARTIKMKTDNDLRNWSILALILLGFISCSCDHAVDFNNPFESNFTIPAPTALRVASFTDTSVSLIWENHIAAESNTISDNIRIVVTQHVIYEQGYDENEYDAVVDTIKGLTSTATIYERLIPTKDEIYAAYYFQVTIIAGSNASPASGYSDAFIYRPS